MLNRPLPRPVAALVAVLVAVLLVVPASASTETDRGEGPKGPKQKVSWTAPSVVLAGAPITVTGRFKPARRGRVVKLQARIGGAWHTLAKDRQSRKGKVAFGTSLAQPGDHPLRLRAKKRRGLRAKSSAVRTLTVVAHAGRADVVPLTIGGVAPNDRIWDPVFSADGRFMAFSSAATNLVPGDTPTEDVFRADLHTGSIVKLSRRSDGGPVNGVSMSTSISADGRWVVFASRATDLYSGDSDIHDDVYLWDPLYGSVNLISANNFGSGSANGDSGAPRISADGSTIAYLSDATNLVSAPTGGQRNAYAYDRDTNRVHLLSGGLGGAAPDGWVEGLLVSATGDQVVFSTLATNVAPGMAGLSVDWRAVWVDRGSGRREWVGRPQASIGPVPDSYPSDLSPDGQSVVFSTGGRGMVPTDTDEVADLYLWSAPTGTLRRVTSGGNGNSWYGFLVPGGRYVLALTDATNLAPGSGPKTSAIVIDLLHPVTVLLDTGPANGQIDRIHPAPDGIHGAVTITDGRTFLFTRLP